MYLELRHVLLILSIHLVKMLSLQVYSDEFFLLGLEPLLWGNNVTKSSFM